MSRWLAIVLLMLSQDSFAKCWSVSELPPTFCVELRVEKVTSSGECLVHGKPLRFSIPRADLQNLKWADALKTRGAVVVKVDAKKCSRLKAGDQLKGLLRATCNDKGQPGDYDYVYYDERETLKTPVGVGGKEEAITCGSH